MCCSETIRTLSYNLPDRRSNHQTVIEQKVPAALIRSTLQANEYAACYSIARLLQLEDVSPNLIH